MVIHTRPEMSHPRQDMTHAHQTAPTQFVEANGIRFAYRRFGKSGGVPLVFQRAFHGDDGPLGSGGDGWPRKDAGGDPVQQRRRLQQLRRGPDLLAPGASVVEVADRNDVNRNLLTVCECRRAPKRFPVGPGRYAA
jgi:hypothetical protein